MAVVVRLRRIGKNPKKRPHFRITVFDQRRGRDSRFIEEIGFYNPITKAIKINRDRLDFWIKKGAQLSATVKNLTEKSKAI
ncbi:MAG: 30S ribosomal protein S16 [Candidatus Omnitrophica bacterium CG23_combo_of_CG06-09_8_20_14_all_40_11]|nr:MAG: 30S ribosomal protein S16 [Candidatus Omnitrophica bacterium CG23_combo_of_CG06-09_8_20_14_all_40_11]